VPNLNMGGDLAANGIDGDPASGATKAASRMLWITGQFLPVSEMCVAVANWVAFQFYLPWVVNIVAVLFRFMGLAFASWLLVAWSPSVEAGNLRIVNLSGTNVVLTNGFRSMSIPPGDLALNLEGGTWNTFSNITVDADAAAEDVQLVRFSLDGNGGLVCDTAVEESYETVFWYGFSSGLVCFGFGWMVAVVRSGLMVSNRWSP